MPNDKVIVYDDSCPMCRLYTYGFVVWGLLKPENRVGFATASPELTANIDLNRGRHEIPLFDRATGETIYGLKAMTHLLASRWGWLSPIFDSRPFWWVFHPMYEIITYNRRVIAGCKHCGGFDCAPDLNRFYRSVYIGLAGGFVSLMMAWLLMKPTTFAALGFSVLAAMSVYGLIAFSIGRVTSGSLVGWNFVGNYITTMVIVASTISIGLMMGTAVPDVLQWTVLGTASLLGITEIKRRDL
ncbi:hypothetical protein Poly51_29240 [Rubripirellula tenax]|uniref:DUF393 domain-containing protein n=1 Tax=Rubripirellula tenax TaxID=2528015 RepID=A0A5C6F5L7_9BACT|nr:hypothetical protein [Rubripirellula tenax]TWU57003.1 hypothetical protein Poly51_29240 [Rubripirellula tenax]